MRFNAILLLALVLASPAAAQTQDDFFNPDVLQRIELWLHESDWNKLKANFQENTYYNADMTWNGITVRNLGIRSRGLGSRRSQKPGLRVDFDYYSDGQQFDRHRAPLLLHPRRDLWAVDRCQGDPPCARSRSACDESFDGVEDRMALWDEAGVLREQHRHTPCSASPDRGGREHVARLVDVHDVCGRDEGVERAPSLSRRREGIGDAKALLEDVACPNSPDLVAVDDLPERIGARMAREDGDRMASSCEPACQQLDEAFYSAHMRAEVAAHHENATRSDCQDAAESRVAASMDRRRVKHTLLSACGRR